MSNLTYTQRSEQCTNPTAIKLLKLMDDKKTNLSVAADVTKKNDLIKLADTLGPEICVLKTQKRNITFKIIN